MRHIYDSLYTKRVMDRVLSNKFKMTHPDSDGYKFFNAMYGIEVDDVRSYLDQAKHYSSLELMDYGIDYKFSEVKIPEVIRSGHLTGIVNGSPWPIKVTTEPEFYDGMPTRFVSLSGFDLTNYIANSGVLGIEYMRTTQEGSGILYINTNIDATTAIISGVSQSYKLPMSDLVEPDYTNISGYNALIQYQSYARNGTYEFFDTKSEETMRREYPMFKKFYLPKDGKRGAAKAAYELPFYLPERYFWDNDTKTYRVYRYDSDTYLDGTQELYHRVGLNNPNGSGVFNVNVFELEYIPISGTLNLYDLDNLDELNKPIPIPQSGIWSYKYETELNCSGLEPNLSRKVVYIGYDPIVPQEYGQPSGTLAELYKYTTWEYVNQGDGVEEFNWTKHHETPIDNRIRIINPISRYYAEYIHTADTYQKCITTSSSTKYIKEDLNEHIYATVDINGNPEILNHKFTKDRANRIGLSFNGIDVRPGSIIDNIAITGERKDGYSVNKSNTTFFGINTLPGYTNTIHPNIDTVNTYILDHSPINPVLSGVAGSTLPSLTTGILGEYIPDTVSGLYINEYYPLFSNSQTDNVLRIKFRSMRRNNYVIFQTNNDINGNGWYLYFGQDNYLYLYDEQSVFKTVNMINAQGREIDIMVAYDSTYSNTITSDKYNLYISVDDQFFTRYQLLEQPLEEPYVPLSGTFTYVFPDGLVDLAYLKIYNERSI